MKKSLIILSVLFLLNKADSQVSEEWVKRFNGPGNSGDGAYSTAVDNSGNVYVTGYSAGSGTGDDYSTIKYNSSGVLQWEKRYNGPGNNSDAAHMIAIDGIGNVYVTGHSRSGATVFTEDFATVKYNSAGVQQWVARYNGPGNSEDIAYQIAVDLTGNVYVTGSSIGNATDIDYATIKYNSSGDSLWVRRYNGPGNSIDISYRIAVSNAGNVYVTGYSRNGSAAGSEDIATLKYNSSGVQQWVQRYNNGANDAGYSIAVDNSDNVYVTGFVWNGFGSLDYITIKYNSTGTQRWMQISGGYVSYFLAVDGSGNVYVTGSSAFSGNNSDYYTIKYDSTGLPMWSKFYNGPGNSEDEAYSLALDDSANVYVTGYSRNGATPGTEDYATVKYNSSGAEMWVQRYNGPANGNDVARSIALDGARNVYVTGKSPGTGTGDDFATIKYSQSGSTLTFNLTAFIQGFYNSSTNITISDTAKVFLRNASSPYIVIDSAKAKLGSTGTGIFHFSNSMNGVNYFSEVKHRNSISTWSSSPVQFVSGNMTYNFATVPTQAYGSNEIQVDLSPLRFAMYSGDINQDGTIDAGDLSQTENDAVNSLSGYVPADVTGDDFVDAGDLSIVENNASLGVSVITP